MAHHNGEMSAFMCEQNQRHKSPRRSRDQVATVTPSHLPRYCRQVWCQQQLVATTILLPRTALLLLLEVVEGRARGMECERTRHSPCTATTAAVQVRQRTEDVSHSCAPPPFLERFRPINYEFLELCWHLWMATPSDSSSRDGEYLWCGVVVLRGGLMEL